jgi:CheY-like chemotaxis protein
MASRDGRSLGAARRGVLRRDRLRFMQVGGSHGPPACHRTGERAWLAVQRTFVRAVCIAVPEPTTGGRVLLVEDEPVLARVYSRALVAAGFIVDLAADGSEGFERLLSGSYDVVVSDVRMPRLNGLDLLQQVRRLRPNVPVVLITAQLDERAYELARELGAARYLLKPVTMEQLARAVQGAVSLKAALARSAERRRPTG